MAANLMVVPATRVKVPGRNEIVSTAPIAAIECLGCGGQLLLDRDSDRLRKIADRLAAVHLCPAV